MKSWADKLSNQVLTSAEANLRVNLTPLGALSLVFFQYVLLPHHWGSFKILILRH